LIWEGGFSWHCFDESFGRDTATVAIEVSQGRLVAIRFAIGLLATGTLVIGWMVSFEAFCFFLGIPLFFLACDFFQQGVWHCVEVAERLG